MDTPPPAATASTPTEATTAATAATTTANSTPATIVQPNGVAPGAPAPGPRRRHRYMESSDINAAFRELFGPLRSSIRRGLTNPGQFYAIEMDVCLPGEVLGMVWIPPALRGIGEPGLLSDAATRQAVLQQLLGEPGAEALMAYVGETSVGGRPVLRVEIAQADGWHVAEYPLVRGRGWRLRDLVPVQHRRLDRCCDGPSRP